MKKKALLKLRSVVAIFACVVSVSSLATSMYGLNRYEKETDALVEKYQKTPEYQDYCASKQEEITNKLQNGEITNTEAGEELKKLDDKIFTLDHVRTDDDSEMNTQLTKIEANRNRATNWGTGLAVGAIVMASANIISDRRESKKDEQNVTDLTF